MSNERVTASGLDELVFARTKLSEVDGDGGHLVIAGFDVEELAGRAGFADACAWLWEAAGLGALDGADVARRLGAARAAAAELVPKLGAALALPDAMASLRAALAQLDVPSADDGTAAGAALVTGAVPVFVAAWHRLRAGLPLLAPDPAASQATDYLRLLTGKAVPPALAAGLDAYLVTVSDHSLNASTFTARVVASTGSDLVSSVVAAVGALKGPLHGGAPGPVLDMLDAIAAPERAESWLTGEVAAGRRIMGMGHRIYRVRDPRAAVLEQALGRLEAAGIRSTRLPLARAVERAAEGILARKHPERALKANVEFYTAVLLDALGIPREVFAATFAVARTAGWCAHVAEQRRVGRLVRPASEFVGERRRW